MPIVQTIDTKYQFEQAFKTAGRGDSFSYKALGLLFDYLDESGDDIELDVVALCCEYNENSVEDIIQDYSIDLDGETDEDEILSIVREYLEDHTSIVGETSDGFIYAVF